MKKATALAPAAQRRAGSDGAGDSCDGACDVTYPRSDCPDVHAIISGSPARSDRLSRLCAAAAERGGVCLDHVCTKLQAKYRFRCAAGHDWSAWGHLILAGKWCPQCANDGKRLTIDEMQVTAAKRGGRCLSTRYEGCRIRLVWTCHAGHVWEASPHDIRNRGMWCRICDRQKGRGMSPGNQV